MSGTAIYMLGLTIVTSIGMGLVFVSMSLVALARIGNNAFDVTSVLRNQAAAAKSAAGHLSAVQAARCSGP